MNGKPPVSFLLSILAWMAFGPLPAHAAAGEGSVSNDVFQYRTSIVGYGVNKKIMLVGKKGGGSTATTEEERCVFDPIFARGVKIPEDYRGWSLSSTSAEKYPFPHLQSLETYHVLDDKGERTGIKYERFEIVMNAYPNFFVGAPVPKSGCGTMLTFPQAEVHKGSAPENMNRFISMLERDEQKLFLSAICSTVAKDVMSPNFDPALCDRTKNKSDYLANKSKLSQFYDGRDWYLVRSYQNPSALILYRIDTKVDKLTPIPGFISYGDGEKYLMLGYVLGVDLDGDGINEMVVRQAGWEWSGFSYLKRKDDTWK